MICLTAAANTKHHACTAEGVFGAKRHTCVSFQAAATAAVAAAAGSSIPHVPDHLLITTYKDVRQRWKQQQQAAGASCDDSQ
jgi:hypothetical protein